MSTRVFLRTADSTSTMLQAECVGGPSAPCNWRRRTTRSSISSTRTRIGKVVGVHAVLEERRPLDKLPRAKTKATGRPQHLLLAHTVQCARRKKFFFHPHCYADSPTRTNCALQLTELGLKTGLLDCRTFFPGSSVLIVAEH